MQLYLEKWNITLNVSEQNKMSIQKNQSHWEESPDFEPYFVVRTNGTDVEFKFDQASSIEQKTVKNGCRIGIETRYTSFPFDKDFGFSTTWWLDNVTGDLICQLSPISEANYQLKSIHWPGPIKFDQVCEQWYTVFNLRAGTLIPNNYSAPLDLESRWELEAGTFYTTSASMPWWGQVRNPEGYLYVAKTPFDAGYQFCHTPNGKTEISPVWHSQLGKIGYIREGFYRFYDICDYNTFCFDYRKYLEEIGEIRTLKEKIAANPTVAQLIGSSIVHTKIYTQIMPSSFYYNKEQNIQLVSFEKRAEQMEQLKKNGLSNAYLHLDGWIKEGYDNQHPDVYPPAPVAGGTDGMRDLTERVKKLGYLFGTHDQYRDYYHDAPSYDPYYSVVDHNGQRPSCHWWAGGNQDYLCNRFCYDYVRRNFIWLADHGIHLDGSYLDVFSCVKLDECYHPEHPMTRMQSMEARRQCFAYVRSQGMIVSSEETIGWAAKDLDLLHHAAYANQVIPDPEELVGKVLPDSMGIPVPLFNLVFHDCLIIPWQTDPDKQYIPNHESGFLHALLNGGIAYVDIEASAEDIKRTEPIRQLHKKVALEKMVRHEFLGDWKHQRTTFSNGVRITVDFSTETYKIEE